jgi:hypothetical protein
MRAGHKQGKMQLIAFTCRMIGTALGHETGEDRTAESPKLCSEEKESRFLLLQCHSPPHGSTLFAAMKEPEGGRGAF